MPHDAWLDLSGIPLRLRLDDPPLGRRLAAEWPRYLGGPTDDPWLDLAVEVGGAPAPEGPLQTQDARAELTSEGARFCSVEGRIEIPRQGLAHCRLAPAPEGRRFYTLVNLICAGLAFRLPERGGLLLHAAAVVLDGRAFVLCGAAGTGKSTWAELARGAGARWLTDDLTFIDGADASVSVLSTPIRAYRPAPEPPGRFPLAALLLSEHGPCPRLAPVATLVATARLAANLPFVSAWIERQPSIARTVQALVARVPPRRLTFAREASFVELLRGLGRGTSRDSES
jgi:hypothetical protein